MMMIAIVTMPFASRPHSSPIATRPATSTAVTTSTRTTTPTADPAKHIFRLYSILLTNPFSPRFELNPLLLNITQPLLSKHDSRRRNLRVLDLGGIEGSRFIPRLASFVLLLISKKNRRVHTDTRYSTTHCNMPAPTTAATQ